MLTLLDNWVLKPEYLPAWLQALAAIIALGISVWAVWWAGAVARRRDRLEIRGLAIAVYPKMEMLKTNTRRVRDLLTRIRKQDSDLVGSSIAGSLQIWAPIRFPPMLERNIDKLFILGGVAGESCLQLVSLIVQYNEAVESIVSHVVTMNAEQWPEALSRLEKQLGSLDKSIEECKHEVYPISQRH